MAVAVIDCLQIIYINKQQAILPAITVRPPAPAIKLFHEMATIEQRCQRVTSHQPFKLGDTGFEDFVLVLEFPQRNWGTRSGPLAGVDFKLHTSPLFYATRGNFVVFTFNQICHQLATVYSWAAVGKVVLPPIDIGNCA